MHTTKKIVGLLIVILLCIIAIQPMNSVVSQGTDGGALPMGPVPPAPGDYVVSLLPENQTGYGEPGTDLDILLVINNTGNYNDTYNLSIIGNTWATKLYNSTAEITTINVTKNTTENITVRVTIPAAAKNGDYDNLTIKAISQNDTSVNDTANITATAAQGNITLDPLIFELSAIAGQSDYGNLTINNTGLFNLFFNITGTGVGGGSILALDGASGGETTAIAKLEKAGYTVTDGGTPSSYSGSPNPNNYTAVIVFVSDDYTIDMPAAGQTALKNYVNNGGGIIFTEWFAYHVLNSRYQTLAPLLCLNRTGGGSSNESWTIRGSHPITTGVPSQFYVDHSYSVLNISSGTLLANSSASLDCLACKDYGSGRVVQFATASNYTGDDAWSNVYLMKMLINSVAWTSGGSSAPWLSVFPDNGTVTPGNETYVNITANASNLNPGFYSANLTVKSNDPDQSYIRIQVNFTVTSADHDIRVLDIKLPTWGEAGDPIPVNATILNQGLTNETAILVQLKVDGLVKNSTTISSLNTSELKEIMLTWTPMAAGDYFIEIVVVPVTWENTTWNNVLNGTIPILATADISIDKDRFWFTLEVDKNQTKNLTISNDGLGDLNYSIRLERYFRSGTSTTTTGDIDVTHTYDRNADSINDTFDDIYIYAYSSDDDTLSVTITGYDGSGWTTIYSGSGGSRVVVNGKYADKNYTRIRVQLDDTENNDNINYTYNFTLFGMSSWLNVTPMMGNVSPLGQTLVNLTANTSGLEPGFYQLNMEIISNDPDEGRIIVPVNLSVLSGSNDLRVWDIVVPPTGEAGSEIFINGTIFNQGTTNETDVEVQLKVDGVKQNSTNISKIDSGRFGYVDLSWIPMVAKTFTVEIYVKNVTGETNKTNNQLNDTINVTAEANINLDPMGFNLTAMAGESAWGNLTLNNSGLADLFFNISIGSKLTGSEEIQVAIYPNNAASVGIETVLDSESDINATVVSVYTAATLKNYDVLMNIRGSNLNQTEVLDFINKGGAWIGEWTSNEFPVTNWNVINGSLAGAGTSGSNTVNLNDTSHYLADAVDWANLPVGTNPCDFMRNLKGINDPLANIIATVNHSSYGVNPLLVEKSYGQGTVMLFNWDYRDDPDYDTYIEDMIQEVVRYCGRKTDCPWLSVFPDNGTVSPVSETYINVTANASRLNPGVYQANLTIYSNDPGSGSVKIPVNFTVLPADHDIRVLDIIVPVHGEAGKNITFNATIFNQGNYNESNIQIQLKIDGVMKNSTIITKLDSGNQVNITLNWTFMSVGDFLVEFYVVPVTWENLTWNNVLNGTINITAEPDIWVNPDKFDISLEAGTEKYYNLTVGNDGFDVLNYNIKLEEYNVSGTSATTTGDLNVTHSYDDNGDLIDDIFEYIYIYAWSSDADTLQVDVLGWDGSSWNSIYSGSGGTRIVVDGQYGSYGYSKVRVLVDDTENNDNINYQYKFNLSTGLDWLTVEPMSGSVSPFTLIGLNMTVNASTLAPGFYSVNVTIRSDDLDEPEIVIVVNVTVLQGDHDIRVLEILHPVWGKAGTAIPVNGTILNQGKYNETSITIRLYVDSSLANSTTIARLNTTEWKNVTLTWTPMTAKNYTVTIYAVPVTWENGTLNNEMSGVINITAESDVWISPYSFDLTANAGETAVGNLTIGNAGLGALDWSFTLPLPTWVEASATSGTVSPSNQVIVKLTGNATSLGAGLYQSVLNLTTNDPANPTLFIYFNMTVYLHDITVQLITPPIPIAVDNLAQISATIYNSGSLTETAIEVQLLINSYKEDSTVIASLAAVTSTIVQLSWTPNQTGNHNLEIYAVPVPHEYLIADNRLTTVVNVEDKTSPVADAGQNQDLYLGDNGVLDGSGSTDNIAVTSWTWTFNYGGVPQMLSGENITFGFNKVGNHMITLTVSDAASNSDTDTIWINVTVDLDPPVFIDVGYPDPAGRGYTIPIHTNVTDESGVAEVYIYFTDVNDNVYNVSMTNVAGTHWTYTIPAQTEVGTVTFHLGAKDTRDNWGKTITYDIEIVKTGDLEPPEIMWVVLPATVPYNSDINIRVKVIDNVEVSGAYLVYKDVKNREKNISMDSLGSDIYSASIPAQMQVGMVFVEVHAVDTNDNWNDTVKKAIRTTVPDEKPPTADAGEDISVLVGTYVEFDGSKSYDNIGIVSFTWTFTYDGGTVTLDGEKPGYKFDIIGEYEVTLTVEDAETNSHSDTMMVVVKPLLFDISIGAAKYTDSTPVVGASAVMVSVSSDTWQDTTNSTGYVFFEDVPPGEFTCTMTLGEDSVEFTVTVAMNGDAIYTIPPFPLPVTEEEVTVLVGPVKNQDDENVRTADVTITVDGETYSGTTDANGYARIDVPLETVGMDAEITITKDGYDDLSWTTDYTEDGDLNEQPPVFERKEETKPGSSSNAGLIIFLVILIIIVLLIIIAVVVAVLFLRKKKKDEEEEPKVEEGKPPEAPQPVGMQPAPIQPQPAPMQPQPAQQMEGAPPLQDPGMVIGTTPEQQGMMSPMPVMGYLPPAGDPYQGGAPTGHAVPMDQGQPPYDEAPPGMGAPPYGGGYPDQGMPPEDMQMSMPGWEIEEPGNEGLQPPPSFPDQGMQGPESSSEPQDILEQIDQLHQQWQNGAISQEEFLASKQRLLEGL
jgi:uncharacterized membrane protein